MSFACLALLLAVAPGDPPYPRAELLIEPAELAKPQTAEKFRILDARPKPQFEAGHVPGAVWVDSDAWHKAFVQPLDAKAWARRIGELGIDNKTRVVVYDDGKTVDAARAWWTLRYWGVRDVRLLHGGWVGWTAGKHPVTRKRLDVLAALFDPAPAAARLATKEQVLKNLEGKRLQVLDVRTPEEYRGETVKAKRGGHIPGALNLEWVKALDSRTKRFKSAEELTKLLRDAGLDLGKPVVAYCQSGNRSSVAAFTLELMGVPEVRNYFWSWAEWGNADDTPVATPKKK